MLLPKRFSPTSQWPGLVAWPPLPWRDWDFCVSLTRFYCRESKKGKMVGTDIDMECTGLQFCHSRHLVNYPIESHPHGPGVFNISFKDLGDKS